MSEPSADSVALISFARAAVAVVSALAAATIISACSSSAGSPRSSTAGATVGDLQITSAYIPQQASPDVAAAYFAVINTGSEPERLVRVTTNVTNTVRAMDETDHGPSASMTLLPTVIIPAHGGFRFSQGHAHLMLEKPKHLLKQGDKVTMTITFSRAGTVRLVLPVVGFTGPASAAPMSGMSDN